MRKVLFKRYTRRISVLKKLSILAEYVEINTPAAVRVAVERGIESAGSMRATRGDQERHQAYIEPDREAFCLARMYTRMRTGGSNAGPCAAVMTSGSD